jgi:hypothetical protein
MENVTVEMENKNLVIEDEIVNSDNDQVETGIIDDVDDEIIRSENAETVNDNNDSDDSELETNSDENEVDLSTNGDTEAEIADGDDTEHGTVSNDGAEIEAEIAVSDTGEGNIDAPNETGVLAATENLDDTGFQEDSEFHENTDDEGDEAALDDIGVQDYKEVLDEIASIDAAEDEIADEDDTETEIAASEHTENATATNDGTEGETGNSDNSDPETANTDTAEDETTSSDVSVINQVACDVHTQVSDDNVELLGSIDLEKGVKDFIENDRNPAAKKFKDPHEIVEVSIYEIVEDIQRYPRAQKNQETIDEYKEALLEGATFPPIVVFRVGEKFLLADGSYRVGAHRRAGLHTISAIVHQGGRKEALLHALGANADHGLRRTNADKEKAVTIALKEPYTRGLSDNQIAEICRVSQPFVSKIRQLLIDNGYKFGRIRLSANGRKINVTKIGKKKKVVSAPTDPVKEKVGAGNPPTETDPETNLQGQNSGGSVDNSPKEETPGAGQTNRELSAINPAPDTLDTEDGDSDETNPDVLDNEKSELEEVTEDNDQENSDPEGTEPIAPCGVENDESGDGTGNTGPEDSEPDDTDPVDLGDEDSDLDGTDPAASDNDIDESEADADDTGPEDGIDPTAPAETVPTVPANEDDGLGQGTGDNDQINSNLDDIDQAALKCMVIELRDLTQKQEADIEAQNSYITDLEQQVEGLKRENEYLRIELQGSIKMGVGASGFLNTNPMSNQHVSSEA